MRLTIAALWLFLALVSSGWTGRTLIETFSIVSKVWGVSRDPSLALTHVLVAAPYNGKYAYYAISDSGSVPYKTYFPVNFNPMLRSESALRVSGNKLFLAFSARNAIMFTESTNGGRSWSQPVSITPQPIADYMIDMVYVTETGQLSVFFYTNADTLGHNVFVVSRAPGSGSFSSGVLVGPRADDDSWTHAAGYSTYLSRCYMHVAYGQIGARLILYVRSGDCGKTWPEPRELNIDRGVVAVHSLVTKENYVYIAYTAKVGRVNVPRLIYSADYGLTFSGPINMVASSFFTINERVLSLCRFPNGESSQFVSLVSNMYAVEYSVWNTTDMKRTSMPNPLSEGGRDSSTGVDCTIANQGTRYVAAVKAEWYPEKNENQVFFAINTEAL